MPVPPAHPSQRRRRNKDRAVDPIMRLPAAGREGDPPSWPLGDPSGDEWEFWCHLWSTPQAVAWERTGVLHRTVARYVRLCIAAEMPGAKASMAGECRQIEEKLGLTPSAMLTLRWAIDDVDELAEVREDRPSAPRRLRAVDSAVAGA